jgi:hypothetical protein
MRTSGLSDSDLAAYSGEHLLYELQMFVFAGRELARPNLAGPMRSIVIESFVIHLRNLIDFFFTPPTHDDDVAAIHFYPQWNEAIPDILKVARNRANKELSHLTLERKTGLHPDKPWDVAALYQSMHKVAEKFVSKASPAKLSSAVSVWVKMSQGDSIAVLSGLVTTNTASSVIGG